MKELGRVSRRHKEEGENIIEGDFGEEGAV